MPSPVSRIPRRRGAVLTAALAALIFSAAPGLRARAVDLPTPPASPPGSATDPFAGRFPDVVLETHEGDHVRFYEDLLKDKIVLINFMYATCEER